MSYSITFKNIPEDVINKYKVDNYMCSEDAIDGIKYNIVESCMKYKEKYDNMYNFIKEMKFNLSYIIKNEENSAKHFVYDDYTTESEYSPKGEFTIEGSNYRGSFYNSDNNKDVLKYCVDELIKFGALIDTPDYWTDNEHWNDKYSAIFEVIDYCIEESYINAMKEIKDELYKYSDEYEEYNKPEEYIEYSESEEKDNYYE